ncbi:hypothetical protein T10_1045 [Trichinella papuae]|uniref:Uncharacterized protein n=1 Tax=Trichinella papuae TaxID=268474 RepID=A0A0V1MMN9_9BILA|nr:hypothetical protein T10_1045 [Trichinella papuae]
MIFHTNADIATTLISNIEKDCICIASMSVNDSIENTSLRNSTDFETNAQIEEFSVNWKMNVKNYVEDAFCLYQEL